MKDKLIFLYSKEGSYSVLETIASFTIDAAVTEI